MSPLHRNSLALTLDSVSEALATGERLPLSQRRAVAIWIASRQGLPGAYANMFAPTDQDRLGIRLFTGEPIRTRAATAHILGEEACRVLTLLNVKDRQVQAALDGALRGMAARIDEAEAREYPPGFYCCGPCTAAYWRNLALGLLPRSTERLTHGLQQLRTLRQGGGRWRRFPFFYTCLALVEIGPNLAGAEIDHAAAYWRRHLDRWARAKGPLAGRRADVGRRLLAHCKGRTQAPASPP